MKHWKSEEIQLLSENYGRLPTSVLLNKLYQASKVTRSRSAVYAKAKELGIKSELFWTSREIDKLTSLCEEYPISQVVSSYNKWARHQGYKTRTRSSVSQKIREIGMSSKLNSSTVYCTPLDLGSLLGCAPSTCYKYFNIYAKELEVVNPKSGGDTTQSYCHYKNLKRWILHHPEILELYRSSFDPHWLTYIVKNY